LRIKTPGDRAEPRERIGFMKRDVISKSDERSLGFQGLRHL
jgi:hypothetical protein